MSVEVEVESSLDDAAGRCVRFRRGHYQGCNFGERENRMHTERLGQIAELQFSAAAVATASDREFRLFRHAGTRCCGTSHLSFRD